MHQYTYVYKTMSLTDHTFVFLMIYIIMFNKNKAERKVHPIVIAVN